MFLDLEVNNVEYYGAVASPRCKDNYVVMEGHAIDYEPYQGEVKFTRFESREDSLERGWLTIPDDVWLLVGHNLAFELDWIWEQHFDELSKFVKRGGMFWCTQLARYRLTRQEEMYPKLSDTAIHYGGDPKLDLVQAEWERGVLTKDIDPVMLRDYLVGTPDMEGDIGNTRIAFYGEWVEATERGMVQAILEQNNALLFNSVCMSNGLKIDIEVGEDNLKRLEKRLAEVEELLKEQQRLSGISEEGVRAFKFGSSYHKSAWIYGGTYRYDGRVPSIDKDGNYRYEKQSVVFEEGSKDNYLVVEGVEDLEEYCTSKGFNPTRFVRGKNAGLIKVERVDSDQVRMINGKIDEDLKGVISLKEYPQEFQDGWLAKNRNETVLACGSPVLSTKEGAIEELFNRPETSAKGKEVLTLFREWAILNKVIGAFFDRVEYYANGDIKKRSGMFQYITDQGLIHHSLNNTATKTGRLSSNKP